MLVARTSISSCCGGDGQAMWPPCRATAGCDPEFCDMNSSWNAPGIASVCGAIPCMRGRFEAWFKKQAYRVTACWCAPAWPPQLQRGGTEELQNGQAGAHGVR